MELQLYLNYSLISILYIHIDLQYMKFFAKLFLIQSFYILVKYIVYNCKIVLSYFFTINILNTTTFNLKNTELHIRKS